MLRELSANNKTGQLSATKFWYSVACLASTAIVLWYAWPRQLEFSFFCVYLATVGGFSTLSKLINYKFDAAASQPAAPAAAPAAPEPQGGN